MDTKNQELELRVLFMELLKKWWLITICVFVMAITVYLYSSFTTIPLYTSEASLFIGKDPSIVASFNFDDLIVGNELVNDYKELLRSRLITETVQNNIDYPVSPYNLNIYLVEQSRIMYISYTDVSPEMAKIITNEFSEVLIEKASEIVGVKNISIVDYALESYYPVNVNYQLDVIIGAALGFVIAIAIILLRIIFDNKIKSDTDLEAMLGTPVLGSIPRFKLDNETNINRLDRLITLKEPASYISECYKMFRTNVNYSNIDTEKKIVLFTSSTTDEGKSTSVANMAVTYAQEGKRVLLVECDLRRATVHKLFGLPQSPGLSELLSGASEGTNSIKNTEEIENLDIITSGQLPPSPADLFEASATRTFFEIVKKKYDIILIDSPPLLHVTDAAILSKYVDGIVLVVAEGESKKESVVEAKKLLDNLNVKVLGVLKTKIKLKQNNYYAYEYSEDNKAVKKRRK